MTEKPAYIVVCGEVRRVDADNPIDCTLILHDHGGAVCETCRKTTLDELNGLAAQVAQLHADNAVLAAEVEAWRALIGLRPVDVLPGSLLVPSLLTRVTHTRHATDASGALARAKEIK